MMKNQIKTASDLRRFVEASGNCPYFFDRATMRFFGDTMRNYGCRGPIAVETASGEGRRAFELYRRRPVKQGNRESAYFDAKTFARVYPKKD